MDKWIDVKKQLSPAEIHVLCVVKNNCKCDHYSQKVLVRREDKHGNYSYDEGHRQVMYRPTDIVYWQYLPKMVDGLKCGYLLVENQ